MTQTAEWFGFIVKDYCLTDSPFWPPLPGLPRSPFSPCQTHKSGKSESNLISLSDCVPLEWRASLQAVQVAPWFLDTPGFPKNPEVNIIQSIKHINQLFDQNVIISHKAIVKCKPVHPLFQGGLVILSPPADPEDDSREDRLENQGNDVLSIC